MSEREIRECQERVAIQDPQHLLRFLETRGPFIIFDSRSLINATKDVPDALVAFQHIVNIYRAFRMTQKTGDFELIKDEFTGEHVKVPVTKDDTLTKTELDRCIRFLVGQITDKDRNWTLDSNPL